MYTLSLRCVAVAEVKSFLELVVHYFNQLLSINMSNKKIRKYLQGFVKLKQNPDLTYQLQIKYILCLFDCSCSTNRIYYFDNRIYMNMFISIFGSSHYMVSI